MGKKLEKRINHIMDNFDFDRVHECMIAMDWEWQNNGVPSISRLKESAEDNLRSAWKEAKKNENREAVSGSGGFIAERRGKLLWLWFSVSDWDTVEFEDSL